MSVGVISKGVCVTELEFWSPSDQQIDYNRH